MLIPYKDFFTNNSLNSFINIIKGIYNIKKNITKSKLPIKSLSKSNYKIIFSTNFGRDIEYYTGMVFEISASKNKQKIARGGRYDDLLKNLGSKKNIPAVGAAIYLDNLSKITQ